MDDNTSAVFAAEGAKVGKAYVEFAIAFCNSALDNNGHELLPIRAEAYNGAFLAFYSHLLDLAFDKYGIPQDAPEGNACSHCWCTTCAKIEDCAEAPRADGITPPPCAECARTTRNIMPFMPRYLDEEAGCGGYEYRRES